MTNSGPSPAAADIAVAEAEMVKAVAEMVKATDAMRIERLEAEKLEKTCIAIRAALVAAPGDADLEAAARVLGLPIESDQR